MPGFTQPGEPEITAMIIPESPSHVVVAVELSKDMLARHRRLIENLLQVATAQEGRDGQ